MKDEAAKDWLIRFCMALAAEFEQPVLIEVPAMAHDRSEAWMRGFSPPKMGSLPWGMRWNDWAFSDQWKQGHPGAPPPRKLFNSSRDGWPMRALCTALAKLESFSSDKMHAQFSQRIEHQRGSARQAALEALSLAARDGDGPRKRLLAFEWTGFVCPSTMPLRCARELCSSTLSWISPDARTQAAFAWLEGSGQFWDEFDADARPQRQDILTETLFSTLAANSLPMFDSDRSNADINKLDSLLASLPLGCASPALPWLGDAAAAILCSDALLGDSGLSMDSMELFLSAAFPDQAACASSMSDRSFKAHKDCVRSMLMRPWTGEPHTTLGIIHALGARAEWMAPYPNDLASALDLDGLGTGPCRNHITGRWDIPRWDIPLSATAAFHAGLISGSTSKPSASGKRRQRL